MLEGENRDKAVVDAADAQEEESDTRVRNRRTHSSPISGEEEAVQPIIKWTACDRCYENKREVRKPRARND